MSWRCRGRCRCAGRFLFLSIVSFIVVMPFFASAQMSAEAQTSAHANWSAGEGSGVKLVTNHVGYESDGAKRAVIVAERGGLKAGMGNGEGGGVSGMDSFRLIDLDSGGVVFSGKPVWAGPVGKWKNWVFWVIDFSACRIRGNFRLQVGVADGSGGSRRIVFSYPFVIDKNVLERTTISDLIYYFKGQRSSGLLDKADRHLGFEGRTGTMDAHGGWYDATGDYGKHLSHLSFSTYFNPQQISLTAWSLLKSCEWLRKRGGSDYRQYIRRMLDEAMYGADYLARVQSAEGSFYRSVGAPGPGKLPKDRMIGAENKGYRIKQSKEGYGKGAAGNGAAGNGLFGNGIDTGWRSYQSSYRSGGGMAIAALAMASSEESSGDYGSADYLRVAEKTFAFLEKNNASMTNDGKENIVDDYCALMAATELYKATKKPRYLEAADKRAKRLMDRLCSWREYHDYWRADDADRPFFHPSDAGLPIVSLLNYYPVADSGVRTRVLGVIRRSLSHELAVTHEVNNPFGYSRQLVQDTAANRRSAFFFPHGSEASPWWQGENARLGSMATAARMAAGLFGGEPAFRDSLKRFALDQLNWILGLNPFDACMLQGVGHNNPVYGFFGGFEYTNAPGGIVNGITSGLEDEEGIDFNLHYSQTGKDYDWRWAEQWLPHASWFLLAVSADR
jgi:hypothetical protein